jgi:hypothetical protein
MSRLKEILVKIDYALNVFLKKGIIRIANFFNIKIHDDSHLVKDLVGGGGEAIASN